MTGHMPCDRCLCGSRWDPITGVWDLDPDTGGYLLTCALCLVLF